MSERCTYCGHVITGSVHYETIKCDDYEENGRVVGPMPFCSQGCVDAYIEEMYEEPEDGAYPGIKS